VPKKERSLFLPPCSVLLFLLISLLGKSAHDDSSIPLNALVEDDSSDSADSALLFSLAV